jgi:hypothetical protein
LTASLAAAVAGLAGVTAPGTAAAAASPVPAGGAKYAGPLVLNDTGSQLKSWNKSASYCDASPGFAGNGKVAASSSGTLALTTTGKAGSCVGLISPGRYSSAVIEADVDFPALPGKPQTIANWAGVWLTGPDWPTDGEFDAVEVEPVNGLNAVTWHSGTSSKPFVASTSGFFQPALPTKTANLTPGWHTVDIVYTKGFLAVYYDGQLYTSFTSSNVTGRPLNLYFTMSNTPNTAWVRDRIGGPPINSDGSSATLAVKYLRVWSYQ